MSEDDFANTQPSQPALHLLSEGWGFLAGHGNQGQYRSPWASQAHHRLLGC
jgi:hypothetical protein